MLIRLTCKHLYVPATKEFAKRFFTKPGVMVNTYSLQALVDICAHPIMGPYPRGITLDARRFGIDACRGINGDLEDSITNGDVKSMKKHGNELQGLLEVFEEDAILHSRRDVSSRSFFPADCQHTRFCQFGYPTPCKISKPCLRTRRAPQIPRPSQLHNQGAEFHKRCGSWFLR